MADCSKTVDFYRERERMCYSVGCDDCPIYRDKNGKREDCENFCVRYTDEAVQVLQAWSDSHPVQKKPKTYADVFLEKFPNQHIEHTNPDWWRRICRAELFGGVCKHGVCEKCWNEPYKEKET